MPVAATSVKNDCFSAWGFGVLLWQGQTVCVVAPQHANGSVFCRIPEFRILRKNGNLSFHPSHDKRHDCERQRLYVLRERITVTMGAGCLSHLGFTTTQCFMIISAKHIDTFTLDHMVLLSLKHPPGVMWVLRIRDLKFFKQRTWLPESCFHDRDACQ